LKTNGGPRLCDDAWRPTACEAQMAEP